MSMLPKKWSLKPPAPPELLDQYTGMSLVLAQVLYNRGQTSPEAAFRFLQAKYDSQNPFQMKGMNRAVGRIRQAIKQRESIAVYGDFDADGVTSTALLVQALRALGAIVKPYIPHRVDEGYGLNSDALLRLRRDGVRLVITVDCGIRSIREVEDGNAAGLDIIITDHHSVGPEIPPALAVINPKQEDCRYGEDMLAGVGVAYKLAEALFTVANSMRERRQSTLSLDDLVDLVAIGTVADLAPLNRAENRVLVLEGLKALNGAKREGVRALLNVAGVRAGAVDASTIGYAIGPRINAAGRLEHAMIAYELLASADGRIADQRAAELQALNVKRQELTRAAQALIRERLEQTGEADAPLIMASDASFQPGIVGLVAGRLVDEYYRPAVIMEEGQEESRGSCRSIPEFDITAALDQCADLLVRHGGHAQAAGFTIRNENIPAFKERLMAITSAALSGKELLPKLEIDAEVDPAQLRLELAEELVCLEPTGQSNPAPVFKTSGLQIRQKRTVGQDDRHLKLLLSRNGGPPIDAIGFNLGDRMPVLTDCVDVAYLLGVNEYNGRRTVQLVLQDVRPAGEEA